MSLPRESSLDRCLGQSNVVESDARLLLPEGFVITQDQFQVDAQVARLLEQLRALDRQYGPMIAQRDPDLARGLAEAALSIDRYLTAPAAVPAQG